ncbi:hypothetical protein ABZ905_25930 [Streptomyces parvus]|uniref:hypothetical protein n=1 Tax=Streptomyces parvus TaxID=66428 RepID=UPI0033D13ABE
MLDERDGDQAAELLGVLVLVDPASDSGGGVFVRWYASSSLSKSAANDSLGDGTNSPSFRNFGFVVDGMHETLIAILKSAGFNAVGAEDDMSPYLICINSRLR